MTGPGIRGVLHLQGPSEQQKPTTQRLQLAQAAVPASFGGSGKDYISTSRLKEWNLGCHMHRFVCWPGLSLWLRLRD